MARKSSRTPAAASGAATEATPGRIAQMRMAAGMVHQANRRALPLVAAAAVGTMAA